MNFWKLLKTFFIKWSHQQRWSSNGELKIKIRNWKFQAEIEIGDILKLDELETCDSVGVQPFWLRNRLYGPIDFLSC